MGGGSKQAGAKKAVTNGESRRRAIAGTPTASPKNRQETYRFFGSVNARLTPWILDPDRVSTHSVDPTS
jgi:hypothetical protein